MEFSSVFIENLGAGEFNINPLPVEAQVSAINDILIYDFNKDNNLDIIIAGGLYESEVQISPNDAGVGLYLEGNGTGGFNAVRPNDSGLYLFSNVTSLKLITIDGEKALVSAANRDRLMVYKIE